jgi:Mannosyl-glycoprotein endo-beta-N-acetylglucosaminidase
MGKLNALAGGKLMATKAQQSAFLAQITPLANTYGVQYGIDPGLIISQAALESNWGLSAPNNNYFGVKGKGGVQTTKEFLNGKWVTIQDSFQGYASMEDSVKGYVDFLGKYKRYAGVFGKSGEDAAAAMGKTGYATDPGYGGKLASIMNNLGSKGVEIASIIPQVLGNVAKAGTDALDDVGDVAKGAAEAVTKGVNSAVATVTAPVTGMFGWLQELFSAKTAARLAAVVIGVLLLAVAVWALAQSAKSIAIQVPVPQV